MENNNFRPISNGEFASSLGITPEQLNNFGKMLKDNPVTLTPQIIPNYSMPQIDPKSTPVYKLQQIVEQGEKQITELKTTNEHLDGQNRLLNQQLDVSHEHKALLEKQLENEKVEKENAIKEGKKNKRWSVVGKILSGLVGVIVFAITVFTTVYPEKSKEILIFIWNIFFPGS